MEKELEKQKEKNVKARDAKKYFESWKAKKDEELKEEHQKKKEDQRNRKKKEEEKEVITTRPGYSYLVTHPGANPGEQGLTLLSGRNVKLCPCDIVTLNLGKWLVCKQ